MEPDPVLNGKALEKAKAICDSRISHLPGVLSDLPVEKKFQTILYIDVLEHIQDDVAELQQAVAHLNPCGHLIVLVPAHQSLFSEFDRSIGHQRRYSRLSFEKKALEKAPPVKIEYLDSVGYFASLLNRAFLRQSLPTLRQILFWDRILVRLSRVLDPLFGFRFGKSILGVWKYDPEAAI